MHFPATALGREAPEPCLQTLCPHQGIQVRPPECLGSLQHTWPHHTWAHECTPTSHRAIRPLPAHCSRRPTSPSLGIHSHRAATLPTGPLLLVDVGIHSNRRVMPPASRVESHDSMAWLRTGVSSGNRPMFVTKMQKIPLTLWRVLAWTEYLEECHSRAVWESLGISEIAQQIR